MATINSSTTHTMKVSSKKKVGVAGRIGVGGGKKKGGGGVNQRRGSVVPALKPGMLSSPSSIQTLREQSKEEQRKRIVDCFLRRALGEQSLLDYKGAPHAASTTRDRGFAAADVAMAAKELGIPFVLLECGVIDQMQRMLFPNDGCVATLLTKNDTLDNSGGGASSIPVLKPSASALSLASMDKDVAAAACDNTTVTSVTSNGTDANRGKTTPPNAREGCLLLIRAFCEIIGGKVIEPYVVGAFLAAALDECGSSSSAIRQAAEDTATAIIKIAHPWAFPTIVCPLLLQSIKSPEWRVKFNALERLQQCATQAASAQQVHRLLPILIPVITGQVWDTKPQVSKAAGSTLLSICKTCPNPDVEPSIPAVVSAICKPSETNKAVEQLMGTTFVVPVDAATLSILCPVLARALKEKLAIHKRAACIVISNMSKLVETPSAVAPFGPLLVPELQKVASIVQFEEIRDEALKALSNLTTALGDSYQETNDVSNIQANKNIVNEVEMEQQRIQQERAAQVKREEELKQKEQEERRKFREAMDAQRELDKIATQEAEQKRKEEMVKRDKQKRSTKTATGKCQACGLKKCKKTCLFYSG